MSMLPPPPPPPPGSVPPPPPPLPMYPGGGYDLSGPTAPFSYAGFWQRVGARLLDGLLSLAVTLPLTIPGIVLIRNTVTCITTGTGRNRTTDCTVDHAGRFALAIVFFVAAAVVWAILYIRWWAKGQTPGMRAAGTRLVRRSTLEPIGAGRATGRFFASYLSNFFFGLGYFWMLWDKQKRTWHDMMCETIVIRA